MPRTLISLGANLGNVRESMHAAKRLLADSFGASNLRLSQLYRTPPVGGPDGQGDFLNAVAAIETERSIWEVWEVIKSIESTLGRQRQLRWEARRIDIDLLLYDQQRIWTPHLKVPHPRMCMRTFVILPACEIAPNWIEPVTGWSVAKLKDHLQHSLSNDSFIRVVCQDERQLSILQTSFDSMIDQKNDSGNDPDNRSDHSELRLVWGTSQPHQLVQDGSPKLTIAAVASPDPTTVLWEDCSKPWVQALDMQTAVQVDAKEVRCIEGPRYLMPADDTKWAIHEILSANQAMRCHLEAVEEF